MNCKPLPYRQLAILCACRFTEPICFTVIFPFIVQMVRDLHMTEEKNVGYYVGFITSCFALSQLLTGIPWGMLSDRIGRRPVICIGLFGTISSVLLFGLSQSFIWALLSRSLCGLLNGNIGVLKSMISEITLDHAPHQRARAFSLLSLMNGLGSIVGPMLGGFLSHPVTNFPLVFGDLGAVTDFLVKFPYFLPCAISAFICTMGLIFGLLFLEETHPVYGKRLQHDSEEEEQLLAHKRNSYSTVDSHDEEESDYESEHSSVSKTPVKYKSPSLKESLTPAVLATCVTYGCFTFQAIFMDELFPLFTASSRQNGGLGFSPNEIGTALAFSGVTTFIAQLFILPALTKRFELLKIFQSALFGLIFLYISQSVIRLLYNVPDFNGQTDTKTWVWVGILLTLALRTTGHTICTTSCTILVNDAAPRVETLGTVNGFAQCCANGTRAFGPASCGIIWSASLSAVLLPYHIRVNLCFLTLSIAGSITFFFAKRLDPANYRGAHPKEVVLAAEDESVVVTEN